MAEPPAVTGRLPAMTRRVPLSRAAAMRTAALRTVAVGVVVLVAGACGPAGSASGTSGANDQGATRLPAVELPTAVPNTGRTPDPGGDTDPSPGVVGHGPDGNTEPGVLDPSLIDGIFRSSGTDGATPVTPKPNLRDVHDVPATTIEAAMDGRRVAVRVVWWSGVEPCYALSGIATDRTGSTITLTIREGSGAGENQMCTEQAVLKAAVVDLGELDPGIWTVRAQDEAVSVTIDLSR